MKCKRVAIYGWKRRNSFVEGKAPVILGSFPEDEDRQNLGEKLRAFGFKYINDFGTCNGRIVSKIDTEETPYYGGYSCEIDVSFVCEKCGSEVHSNLPRNVKELNKFLQDVLDAWR